MQRLLAKSLKCDMIREQNMRRWRSGQSQQTVNLSSSGYVGSNPTRRTKGKKKGYEPFFLLPFVASVGFEGRSRGYRRPGCRFYPALRAVINPAGRAVGESWPYLHPVVSERSERKYGGDRGANPTRRKPLLASPPYSCSICLESSFRSPHVPESLSPYLDRNRQRCNPLQHH